MRTLFLFLTCAIGAASACAAPVPVIFDTDIMGDVDDVGAVAVLHALADKGEAQILAMGISSKHPGSGPCLAALNTYFKRPDIPIGVNKGEGFLRDTKYATAIAQEYPHAPVSESASPSAAKLYQDILSDQPDHSVVMISVGQLSNFSQLLQLPGGRDLVARKVKVWVCMGGKFPEGREANFFHDTGAAVQAVREWPTPIIFSGWEIGQEIITGKSLGSLPETSPVRRAYTLYNNLEGRQSWDQTAVLYAIRGLEGGLDHLWQLKRGGVCEVLDSSKAAGENVWRDNPQGTHAYLVFSAKPAAIAALTEDLMRHQPGK